MVWTPPPCGIVLEASGHECHRAEGPVFQSHSQVDFLGRDSCLDHRQPFQTFKVALTVFISFSAMTFSIKHKLLVFLNTRRNSSKCYPCKHNPGGCLSKNLCPKLCFPPFWRNVGWFWRVVTTSPVRGAPCGDSRVWNLLSPVNCAMKSV